MLNIILCIIQIIIALFIVFNAFPYIVTFFHLLFVEKKFMWIPFLFFLGSVFMILYAIRSLRGIF